MRFDIGAREQDGVERAPHVADARDAVRDEERKDQIPAIARTVAKERVGVHVPQPWDDVVASGVYDLATADRCRRADAGDPVSLNHDGRPAMEFTGRDVDDGR